MEVDPLWGNSCTIADIVVFCGTVIDARSCFFPRNIPFQTSVVFLTIHNTLLTARGRVFLTIHNTLLTARGRRVFFVSVSCAF